MPIYIYVHTCPKCAKLFTQVPHNFIIMEDGDKEFVVARSCICKNCDETYLEHEKVPCPWPSEA